MTEFVGPQSSQDLSLFDLSDGYMDWMLEEDSNKWLKSKSQSYNESCDFAMKLNCTNDEAERNIKLLEDNLEEGQFERVFFNIIYWLFQSIVNWRKVIVQN